jgi:NADP-dependent aldehyde dehydrogenase
VPAPLGLELVSHPAVAASAFTGSRRGGLALKAAADRAGKPLYAELSAVNPVFVLAGALEARSAEIAKELAGSCTLGAGQFCTKPGLSVVPAGEPGRRFAAQVEAALCAAPRGALFSATSAAAIADNVALLRASGAELVCGGSATEGPGFGFENTLLTASGEQFLENGKELQTEAFGPVHLMLLARDTEQMEAIARRLEGSLTGCIYSAADGRDDTACARIERQLRFRVGRLLNDKMPTGVAVSPAMNHGGPFPATGHPGFTSVGMPGSIARFTALHCYDGVRQNRLPPELRDENPTGRMWRRIDGEWKQA